MKFVSFCKFKDFYLPLVTNSFLVEEIHSFPMVGMVIGPEMYKVWVN